ncbi:MAG: anaerobic ribonucleoside-triphosphate reductase activating protein [Tannerellaceae bacterium]|nr:anaerobic ribonucleoside-triphosphate reductase activating protein [Tannerellaceae bacterium]
MLSILDIIEDTTVDGPGFRTAIYAAGCPHRCPGCHNSGSWDIRQGQLLSAGEIADRVLKNELADVTFTGGDPLYQPEGFTRLARIIKEKSSKTIWCYTGYRFEALFTNPVQYDLLKYIDVLVDGRFEQSQRQEGLIFRGSANQRLIDVQASLQTGQVILFDYKPQAIFDPVLF